MNQDTIFDQKSAHNNLTCVAAVTFIPNPSTHLNVLWLGVTNVPTFLNQSMVTWRRNGLGCYLMLVLIQQQVTSNTLPKVFLQCSRNEASFNFYTLIGFVPCLEDDEKKAGFTTLPSHAHMVETDIMNMVLHENMLRKAGLSHIDCSQSIAEVEQSPPSSFSTLVYCRFPPSKGTAVADLDACCQGLPVITLLGLPCIQPQHRTYYKPMGYTAKGFVKGDTRIEFEASSFVKSSTIDLVFGYLLRSGLHDEFVTVVPLLITQKCQSWLPQASNDPETKAFDRCQRGHWEVLIK
jgi:hypothetical protein